MVIAPKLNLATEYWLSMNNLSAVPVTFVENLRPKGLQLLINKQYSYADIHLIAYLYVLL